MKFHAAYFIFSVLFSHIASSNSLEEWAQSKRWKTMLYMSDSSWFSEISRSDSKKFFITEGGFKNPQEELEASVLALKSETGLLTNESFSCRFPARSRFIHDEILKTPMKDLTGCLKLNDWRQRLSAESVTLVFSSFYLGNPSSTFGHTLLRINNSGQNKTIRRELLSYGINYGANPWTQNPVLYTFNGLFGFFEGQFIAIPYYYKVREYNDYESRDLWEYDLDLTNEEVSRMVDLLWEQGENYYDYYFLSENCGYYIVALIEAAAPRYDILSKLRKWVIPSDTITQIYESGAIKNRKYRPSIYNQFLSRLDLLNPEQEKVFRKISENISSDKLEFPDEYKQLSEEGKSLVLDAELDFYDYKNSKNLIDQEQKKDSKKEFLLNERSQVSGFVKAKMKDVNQVAPEKAHGSYRWQLTAENNQPRKNPQETSMILGGRFAFHDLEDPLPGEPEGAHIEVMNLQLQVTNQDVDFKKLNILELGSYTSWSEWSSKGSYHTQVLLERDQRSPLCQTECTFGKLNLGYGLSKKWNQLYLTGLIQGKYITGQFDSVDHHNGRHYFALSPQVILQWDFSSSHQFRLQGDYDEVATSKSKIWFAQAVYRWNLPSNLSFELGGVWNETTQKSSFSMYYFTF